MNKKRTKQSSSVDAEVLAEFKRAIDSWRARKGDEKFLRDAYASDRKDLRAVLSLMKRGRMASAYEKALTLDTVICDTIPRRVWSLMGGYSLS